MPQRTPDERRASRDEGLRAEQFVADALQGEGYAILDRNVSLAGGELDLVVQRGRALRFVEVKARAPGDPTALESITRAKRRRLQRAAEAWLQGRTVACDEVAFAVAAVTLDPTGWQLEFIDDAFDAEG